MIKQIYAAYINGEKEVVKVTQIDSCLKDKELLDKLKLTLVDVLNKHKTDSWSFILLVGGKDIASFRLRVAQSHFRNDLLPSYWSDCGVLNVNEEDINKTTISNVPLFQENKVYAPTVNGIQESYLSSYINQGGYVNFALIAIPIAQCQIISSIDSFKKIRAVHDNLESILPWLSYVWGVSNKANPLLANIGLPSAVMINRVYTQHGWDLAPGINAALSTPESFWGALKYWTQYYASVTEQETNLPFAKYFIGHDYDIKE